MNSVACLVLIAVGLWAFNLRAEAKSEIKLDGKKDLVLSSETRSQVIEVGEENLSRGDSESTDQFSKLMNPFLFEQPKKPVVEEVKEEVVEKVSYSDEAILKAISLSISRQVQGTMAMGANRFIQMKGGGVFKAGSTIPARLPQIEGEVFNVVITNVGEGGFTIKLKDASMYVPYAKESLGNSSEILRNEP